MKTDCLFLYVEGAVWDTEEGCLMRRKPRALVVELLIVKVIIKDTEHLWLLVWTTDITGLHSTLQLPILMVFTNYIVVFLCLLYHRICCRKRVYATFMQRIGMGVGLVFEAVCLCLTEDRNKKVRIKDCS